MGSSESREASPSSSSSSRSIRRSLPPQSSIEVGDAEKQGIRAGRRSASMPNEREVVATERRHVLRPRPFRRHRSSSSSSSSNDRIPRERGGIERGQEATEETSSQLSYWYLLKHGYTELVNLIIRPPRTDYDMNDIGPMKFFYAGRTFVREDFTVLNDRKQKLVCSLWRPATLSSTELMPCVVYLHGNSSCRLEALGVLRTCLAAGLSVAAFDTAGCGKSDGEYISLGYYERDDLRDVVTYLRAEKKVGAVALWGRSMGAATALLHADRDPSIAGIVVDSAFASLEQLVEEVVERGRQEGLTLPGFLVKIVLKFIRSSVKKRAHFNLRRLAPIDHAPVSFVPALIVAAVDDTFIAPHHSDQIFAAYGGDKNLVKVDGDHNSSRPQFLLDSAAIFLQMALQVNETESGVRSRFFGDTLMDGGGRAPWEGAIGHTSSLSMCLSPASSFQTTMEARNASKAVMVIPTKPWSCASCTYRNRLLSMQCEMCQNINQMDPKDESDDDSDDDELDALSTRRRASTLDGVVPRSAPANLRRRTLGARPFKLRPSFVASISAHRMASSGVAVTTLATCVPARTLLP
ncbi:hypothetical protein CCR75_004856 [Bremia lactucae]|uniref:RanBP2-type domain-containing protein n=1 Tax=Bremia lactucae TaxID=4779 RepID=A0A976FIF2_BRELC|nr:hypothetical protein CCR75_004856 [Bremia lactucae]